jgi:hypothetical protein
MLAVSCNRCERCGRLRTARLLRERGADLPMPALPPDFVCCFQTL